jgi:hypothetical protein
MQTHRWRADITWLEAVQIRFRVGLVVTLAAAAAGARQMLSMDSQVQV